MITTLQRTDRFLLEHAYAQAQLYYTQLYTEADQTQEEINADLEKKIASLEAKLDSKTKSILGWAGWAIIQAAKLTTAAAIYSFDWLGGSMYAPEENFQGGPTTVNLDLASINRENAVGIAILTTIALYHLKKANYLAAFLFLLATIPGVADKMQVEIFAAGAVSMLFVSFFNQLKGYDLTLPANQLIFKKFIVKLKMPIKKAITENKLLNQTVKKFFLWLLEQFTPLPKGIKDPSSPDQTPEEILPPPSQEDNPKRFTKNYGDWDGPK